MNAPDTVLRAQTALLPDQETMAKTIAMSLDALRGYATAIEKARREAFTCDLSDTAHRIRLAPQHPMLESNYLIETSEATRIYELAYDYVLARKSGLVIYGRFRVGKSKAIEYAVQRLEADFPFMAFAIFDGERRFHQRKEGWCRDVLESWNYPWSRHQNSSKVLERYMMTRAVQAGGKVFVLFVDEAQMLTVMHYRYLLETWNALRRQGFIVVTILVGQETLPQIAELTSEQDHGAVVARFFSKLCPIGGIRSEENLEAYLAAYDEKLHYPEGKWPYTRFFLNEAFDAGWRLKSTAKSLWDALMTTFRPSPKELLQHGFRLDIVSDTVHSFFLDAMPYDAADFSAAGRWPAAILSVIDAPKHGS